MKLGKRILKSETFQTVAVHVAALFIKLLLKTVRWKLEMPEETNKVVFSGKPFVAGFWHGRLLLAPAAWPFELRRCHVLISTHRDGRLIANAIRLVGMSVVEGSSRRGGASALREMQKVLARGDYMAITPDGPKGPRMRAKLGAIKTAQMAGVPVIPLAGSVSRQWQANSWDRFTVPLPFSKGHMSCGTPIWIPEDADDAELDRLRQELEDQINALTQAGDKAFGHELVLPAEPGEEKAGKKSAGKKPQKPAA
ncbi:lysophospholipid acyltransferase family protein [Rhodovibrionaceae bacterium A322]